jgi:curved DNA-binding protein CbpA
MARAASDPYAMLGVASDVSDLELRRVYRDLVKRHHPDHNGGSHQAAARFAQIQDAYAQILSSRRASPTVSADPAIDARLAEMERQVARERAARERAARERAGRERAGRERSQTREELGQYETDDSFTKIIHDATERLADLFGRDSE